MNSASFMILIDGSLSAFFQSTISIHQGCLLSPSMLVLKFCLFSWKIWFRWNAFVSLVMERPCFSSLIYWWLSYGIKGQGGCLVASRRYLPPIVRHRDTWLIWMNPQLFFTPSLPQWMWC